MYIYMYIYIYVCVCSGILSGIYSTLTFYLTFFLASILAFSLACVRVQAWPTASGARDMEFGSRSGPLHPERAKEMKKKVHKIAE